MACQSETFQAKDAHTIGNMRAKTDFVSEEDIPLIQ